MKSLGVDPLELRTSIEQAILSTIPKQKIDAKSSIPLTVRAEEVLKFAVAEAENTLKTSEVEVHHFWLSILKHSDGTTWAMVGSEKVNYNQYLKAIWARKKLYDHLIVSDGPKENHTTWLKQKLGLK